MKALSPEDVEQFEEEFRAEVEELERTSRLELPDIDVRNAQVEELISYYVIVTGDTPSSKDLVSLANYLLADTLKDPDPYKTQNTEYPIQSQYSRRETPKRELSVTADILDFLHSKYQKRLDSLYVISRKNKEESC